MRFIHQPGSKPLEGYTIQRGIHRGGFGEVYYARSDGGKDVALKLLQREQDVELRGVLQCLNLKHPNLVNLFDVRQDALGEQWVVMEYVNGTSLEDVLACFPNGLPMDEVRQWLEGIVAGVGYLHDRGIVHRDLKPANVYCENGTVKVGDVGLSKRLGSDRRGTHTQSVGTVYYMAPEVGRGQYGPEVDVYSLGIMLYEMLTGRLPFTGETTAEVLMKHLTASPNLEPVPAHLRLAVTHALDKDPQRRTSSVVEVQQEFLAALSPIPIVNGSLNGSHTNGTTGFANGALLASGSAMKDTATHASSHVPPLPTRTAAQAASAYAQYPPERVVESPERRASTKPAKPQRTYRTPVHEAPAKCPQKSHGIWPALVAGAIALWLFSPGSWRAWSGLLVLGTAYSAGTALRNKSIASMAAVPVSAPRTVPIPVAIPFSQSVTDLGTSLSLGSVSASLISIGALLSAEFVQHSPKLLAPDFMAMFTATSIAATWLVLLSGKLLRKGTWFEQNPRKSFLAIGVLTGLTAYVLQQFLIVDFTNQMFGYSPAYRTIGVHPLIQREMNPTWLGYAVFFGGLMFWHRWWKDMAPQRNHRVSLARIATAGLAAWLLTFLFAFPPEPAILWAITISFAVQLSSTWSPRPKRGLFSRS